MKTTHIIVLAAAGLILAACAKPQPRCYSREMVNARMSAWYNKDNCVGFPNANSTNGVTVPETAATWDYVPGVVAKGILDVWEYYQDSAWADAWYLGIAQWADSLDEAELDELVRGGILDDLNCAKVFLGLYEGAKPDGKFENPEKSYWGQMWCDGAYMGPALLAQLLAAGACDSTGLGWNDVYTQFEASWPFLWDEEKQLLYHVLFTDVTTNKNARMIYEAGHAYKSQFSILNSQLPPVYHSEESWGRAAGWYILALVDVMEAYLESLKAAGEWHEGDPLPSAQHFDQMRDYLTLLADGLVARQDPETGCWYQLLQYGPEKCATQGVDDTGSAKFANVEAGGTQCNYLESSASCLITAALLKGSRLGLIHHAEAGKRGFEGIVKQFVKTTPSLSGEGWGEANITSSCQSAGLSHDRNGTAAYYLIGKDVPIQDNTEGKVLGAYLMAAVEYERMAR